MTFLFGFGRSRYIFFDYDIPIRVCRSMYIFVNQIINKSLQIKMCINVEKYFEYQPIGIKIMCNVVLIIEESSW